MDATQQLIETMLNEVRSGRDPVDVLRYTNLSDVDEIRALRLAATSNCYRTFKALCRLSEIEPPVVFGPSDRDVYATHLRKWSNRRLHNLIEGNGTAAFVAQFLDDPQFTPALDSDHYAAFRCAIQHGSLEVAKLLAKRSGEPKELYCANAHEALRMAVSLNHLDIVKWLVENDRYQVNLNFDKSVLLGLAIENGCLDVLKYLASLSKSHLNFCSTTYHQGLDRAIRSKHVNVLRWVVEDSRQNLGNWPTDETAEAAMTLVGDGAKELQVYVETLQQLQTHNLELCLIRNIERQPRLFDALRRGLITASDFKDLLSQSQDCCIAQRQSHRKTTRRLE